MSAVGKFAQLVFDFAQRAVPLPDGDQGAGDEAEEKDAAVDDGLKDQAEKSK